MVKLLIADDVARANEELQREIAERVRAEAQILRRMPCWTPSTAYSKKPSDAGAKRRWPKHVWRWPRS